MRNSDSRSKIQLEIVRANKEMAVKKDGENYYCNSTNKDRR